MDINEVKVGDKVWTMVGKRPVKMEVFKVPEKDKSQKNKYLKRFRNIWLNNPCKRESYTRYSWELFKTYEELRDFIFPDLEDKVSDIT